MVINLLGTRPPDPKSASLRAYWPQLRQKSRHRRFEYGDVVVCCGTLVCWAQCALVAPLRSSGKRHRSGARAVGGHDDYADHDDNIHKDHHDDRNCDSDGNADHDDDVIGNGNAYARNV